MRRFSQRNSLVTLSEINITPLLDLAFVLLVIFIITTPMLEGSLDMNLPGQSTRPDVRPPKADDIRTVEIDRVGNFRLQKRPMTLDQIEAQLVADHRANPNLIIRVRGDKDGAPRTKVLGDNDVLPVWDEPVHDISKALSRRTSLGRQAGVPGVMGLRPRILRGDRRRGNVIGPPPQHELLLAVLVEGFLLVLAL